MEKMYISSFSVDVITNPWPKLYSGLINQLLAPGRFQFNLGKVIFKLNLVNVGWGISYEIALRWMSQDLTDDKSTLIQVMAWCRQATSHYLSQCWPRSMLPYGVTRPQWVKAWIGNYIPLETIDVITYPSSANLVDVSHECVDVLCQIT